MLPHWLRLQLAPHGVALPRVCMPRGSMHQADVADNRGAMSGLVTLGNICHYH